jgi:hypothetical protein
MKIKERGACLESSHDDANDFLLYSGLSHGDEDSDDIVFPAKLERGAT